MISPEIVTRIRGEVRRIVGMLVGGDYVALEELSNGIRLSATEMKAAVHEYGRSLCQLPEGDFEAIDVIEVKGEVPATFSVWVGLWTLEEGRSDLSLELTVIDAESDIRFEIDNLHVH